MRWWEAPWESGLHTTLCRLQQVDQWLLIPSKDETKTSSSKSCFRQKLSRERARNGTVVTLSLTESEKHCGMDRSRSWQDPSQALRPPPWTIAARGLSRRWHAVTHPGQDSLPRATDSVCQHQTQRSAEYALCLFQTYGSRIHFYSRNKNYENKSLNL